MAWFIVVDIGVGIEPVRMFFVIDCDDTVLDGHALAGEGDDTFDDVLIFLTGGVGVIGIFKYYDLSALWCVRFVL